MAIGLIMHQGLHTHFGADFRQLVKTVNPDAFLFGEVVSHSER